MIPIMITTEPIAASSDCLFYVDSNRFLSGQSPNPPTLPAV